MIKRPIIIISGPTASGKTAMAIELAETFQKQKNKFEIVNFDSLLFYHEISIGTAKPTKEELSRIKHHLVDIRSIRHPMNAADFCHLAEIAVDQIHLEEKIPVLVGGSAFYIRALIKGMYEDCQESNGQINQIQVKLDPQTSLHEQLKLVDPLSAEKLHPNDTYRLTRALNFFANQGVPISKMREETDSRAPYDLSLSKRSDWSVLHLYLDAPKEETSKRISLRAEKMINDGLLKEYSQLIKSGFTGEEKPLLSVGYKEVGQYYRGEIQSMDELKERIIISTRQLAKSQRTFFKKFSDRNVISSGNFKQLEEQVKKFLNELKNAANETILR